MAKNQTADKKPSKSPRANLLEFHVELEPTEPRVWRRFIVHDSISMYELHEILQVVMGWMHLHLFEFTTEGVLIGVPSPDDDWPGVEFKNARKVKVSQFFKNPGDVIAYEYDLGDSWDHTLRLERIVDEAELPFDAPRCIAGENACPPEDCGGFYGFKNLKEAIADPTHEEHETLSQWLEEYYPNYDPKEFSLGAVNKILKIGASKFLRVAPMLYR